MPSLANHQSNSFTKLLLIGDAKSGKTGSLVSLVAAGYKLRILDLDNLLDVLKFLIQKECPDKIGNVEFRSLRDKRKATANGATIPKPTAFISAVKMLERWKYTGDDGSEIDLGDPSEWGPDCVLVIDSLSRLCDAAYDWRDPLTPIGRSGEKDNRATYGDAQDAIESLLAMITSDGFATNVVVIAHVQYMEQPDGTKKGFPQGVGQALSPKIPQYFPSYAMCTRKGDKRTIQTTSTRLIDLANPKAFAMEESYPIETGLATFFEILREVPEEFKTQVRRIK